MVKVSKGELALAVIVSKKGRQEGLASAWVPTGPAPAQKKGRGVEALPGTCSPTLTFCACVHPSQVFRFGYIVKRALSS